MNMTDYIKTNWKEISDKVRAVCKHHQNFDDLLQDLAICLLEKPNHYQMSLLLNGKVQHWFVSSANIQFKSKTSPYYYKYRKFLDKTCEITDWNSPISSEEEADRVEVVKDLISEALNTYNVYVRTLTSEHLLGGKSYSQISREYKINRKYIADTITPAKQEIIKKVQEQCKQLF
jgi:DNA-directed RNA polymerase specialized sigma24 family protein